MTRRMITSDGTIFRFPEVRLFRDEKVGIVRCAAALTDGPIGPGLGGTRQSHWTSDRCMAEDVFLLALGMRDKAAFHELPFRGGKMCVQLEPDADVERAFEAVGKFVRSYGGDFVTTEDMGTSPQKMSYMKRTAGDSVLGSPVADGGSGDPSPHTALGVFRAVEAVVDSVFQHSFDRVSVFVKGVGNVGGRVARMLLEKGARVLVADNDASRLTDLVPHPNVIVVENVKEVDADIFCPCAVGGDVGFDFDMAGVRAIVGGANNQLVADEVANRLHARGVLYVPDWVVNGGGLISVAAEYLGESDEWVRTRVEKIRQHTLNLVEASQVQDVPPLTIANQVVAKVIGKRQSEVDVIQ